MYGCKEKHESMLSFFRKVKGHRAIMLKVSRYFSYDYVVDDIVDDDVVVVVVVVFIFLITLLRCLCCCCCLSF